MTATINTDSIGNKYIGYAGDLTDIATGQEIFDNLVSLISSFSNNTAQENNFRIGWRTDGTSTNVGQSNNGNSFFNFTASSNGDGFALNSKDAGSNDIHISPNVSSSNPFYPNLNKGVAYSNGIDVGIFAWSLDSNGDLLESMFIWVGEVLSNPNISRPQTRSGILMAYQNGAFDRSDSVGVKQGDSSTQRLHLDTESGASHNIDCGTDTAKLFLIEDDGAGGDGGTVGYCENLYISKQVGLTIGGFVTLNDITDGGSTQGIVVGDWGTDAKIIMRVYDGTN